jgi:hypothetical protein
MFQSGWPFVIRPGCPAAPRNRNNNGEQVPSENTDDTSGARDRLDIDLRLDSRVIRVLR